MIFLNEPRQRQKTDKKGQARERREMEFRGRALSGEQSESQKDQ